jgi:hypothetical protein
MNAMTYIRVTPINRPVHNVDWKREQTQAELDEEQRYFDERKALKAEFKKQWARPASLPVEPTEDDFEAHAIEEAAFECWKLRRQGFVAAATAPYWFNNIEDAWLTINDFQFDGETPGVFDREITAASVTLPFVMPSGEFAVTYESEKHQHNHKPWKPVITQICHNKRLRIVTEHGAHFGKLKEDIGDMSVELVILPNGTPQDVADRVAAAYSKIIRLDMPADYAAVLPPRDHCAVCGRPLTDQVSKIVGIGPTCAARFGLPHSVEHANRIIVRRRELIGE